MHTLLLIIDHITILNTNSLCLNILRIKKWILELIEINEGILNQQSNNLFINFKKQK